MLDTYMDKNSWIHTFARLIGFVYGTDLLDTYMNNNSWIHTLTRLIGFIHRQICWILKWTKILGCTH